MDEAYTGDEPAVRLMPQGLPTGAGAEFAFWPQGVPLNAIPLYDEEFHAVVGFYHESGGLTRVYDLQGRLVSFEEAGLETPLIDPFDIFLFGGTIRAVTRGAFNLFSRSGSKAAIRASAGMAAFMSSRAAGHAIGHSLRLTFRALTRRSLQFTTTTAARMADPSRHVPAHILQQAIETGTRTLDPRGAAGAAQYTSELHRLVRYGNDYRWQQYTLKVVVRESDWTVLHFHYF